MNGWVGDRIEGMIGRYGVPRETDYGKMIHRICALVGMSVANTYFQQKDVHDVCFSRVYWEH